MAPKAIKTQQVSQFIIYPYTFFYLSLENVKFKNVQFYIKKKWNFLTFNLFKMAHEARSPLALSL